MLFPHPHLLPAGDSAILVDWGDEIDDETNKRVHAFARALRARGRSEIIDLIPAYSSLLVGYEPRRFSEQARALLESMLTSNESVEEGAARIIEMPTCYGGESGPDLAFVASRAGISEHEVIRLHSGTTYRVYMLGFVPGFAYLGSVPQQIAAPRLATPRTRVPAGSVGIAGRQTGVYPIESPGGWRLIGHADVKLFDPSKDPPTLLQPGDQVRFVPV